DGGLGRPLPGADRLPRPPEGRPPRHRRRRGQTPRRPRLLRVQDGHHLHRPGREAERRAARPPQAGPQHPREPGRRPRRRPLRRGLGQPRLRHGARKGRAAGARRRGARRRRPAPARQVPPVRGDEDRREPGDLRPGRRCRLLGGVEHPVVPGAAGTRRDPRPPVRAPLPPKAGARRGRRAGARGGAVGALAPREAALALRRGPQRRDQRASRRRDGRGVALEPGDGRAGRRGRPETLGGFEAASAGRARPGTDLPLPRRPRRLPRPRASGERDHDGRAIPRGGGPERAPRRLRRRAGRGLDVRPALRPGEGGGGAGTGPGARPARAA
ncbi:MAG: Nitroreductase family protein Rcas_3978, partial [uncultured Rubrobacteraceae bacterium]